ncbi:hypothetical protein EDB92DRAFT_1909152 [Lactarius akahatsu]|uniref:Uncharacterized protein n=1 Tax=Lactarius akahatsu TaxID=416441 RepID=A0AAD4Q7H9_9AGAM|nr:hypothetical protein EDB92DRAFT_1909152 [Lactarius akahatsu]
MMDVDDQECEIIEVIDLEGERIAVQQQEQAAPNPGREHRNVETADRERDLSLSMALVPYCGHSDIQRPNLQRQLITDTREEDLSDSVIDVQNSGGTLAIQQQEQEASQEREQPVETAHRERGDDDAQHPNLALHLQRIDEVANQEHEQQSLDTASSESSLSLSMALVPYRRDPQHLSPTMRQQEWNAVNRGREQQQHIVEVTNPEREGLAAQHTEQVATNLGREMEVANRDRLGTSVYQPLALVQWGQETTDRNEDGAPAISVGGVLSIGCKKSNQQHQVTAESRERFAMTHKLLTGVSANLRILQREGGVLNEVGQRAALGESAGGRTEASQATRWRQPESRTAQSPVALHVVHGRNRQATNGSAHTASNSNWLTTRDSGLGDDRTGESQKRPTENTGMEIDGEVPGQEQCMGDGKASGSGQSHLISADVCWERLDRLTVSIDRQGQLLESLLNHTMTRPGGTSPSLNPRDSESTKATVIGKKRGLEFRLPTCRRHGKAPDELDCRAAVRKHVNRLMGRKRTDAPPEPASTEAILNYKSTLNEKDGPSMEHFQADFSEKYPGNSAWNGRLCDLFVDDYVKQGLPFTTVTKLSVFFITYLETLQTANRKMAATAEQARAYKEASQRNRIEKRKKTRFDTQISALHYYKISRFIKPLEGMSRAALSDDESDHEQGTHGGQSRYSIVNETWRSKELVIWLRTIDLLACGEKWGGRNIARQGNSRRIRLHSTRSKDGIAIAGLPENCYDAKWLTSLKRYQRDKLDVQPPVDLAFSEEEKRLAAQFIPLAKGDVRPVSQDVVDISTLEKWLLHGGLENC